MKRIRVLLLTVLAILLVMALAACDNDKGDEPAGTPEDTKVETNENVGNETDGSNRETGKVTESETEVQTTIQTEQHIHSYGEWQAIIEATCNEEGLAYRICACGDKETNVVRAIGHTINGNSLNQYWNDETAWTITKEPTCTTSGEKALVCTACGVAVNPRSISRTGHTIDW